MMDTGIAPDRLDRAPLLAYRVATLYGQEIAAY
jgi:hypothetical protein